MAVAGQFTKLRTLGEGGFGSVHLINHRTWGEVACKKMKSVTVSPNGTGTIAKEARIQQSLRHPNIVILFDFLYEPPRYLLFLEYMKYGSVDEFLKIYSTRWQRKAQIVYEMILGMAYLHEQKPPIIHGDLTCGNILIGQDYHAKVSDFGLAHIKEISKSKTENPNGGTTRYMAPEYFRDLYKKKIESYDVYGFAICVWEIFSEKTAYYDCTNQRALHVYVEKGERPNLKDIDEEVPGFVTNLICACWNGDVETRPTFDDIKAVLHEEILPLQKMLEPPIRRRRSLGDLGSSFDRTGSFDQSANRRKSDPMDIILRKEPTEKMPTFGVTEFNPSGQIQPFQNMLEQPVKRVEEQSSSVSRVGSIDQTASQEFDPSGDILNYGKIKKKAAFDVVKTYPIGLIQSIKKITGKLVKRVRQLDEQSSPIDQTGQNVNQQYNPSGTIIFSIVHFQTHTLHSFKCVYILYGNLMQCFVLNFQCIASLYSRKLSTMKLVL